MFRCLPVALVVVMVTCVGCKKNEEKSTAGPTVPGGTDAPKLDPDATMVKGPNSASVCFAFSPDGKTIVSGAPVTEPLPNSGPAPGDDHTLFLWDVATGKKVAHLAAFNRSALDVCFSEDGKSLFVASLTGCVKLDASTGAAVATIFHVPEPPASDINREKRGAALSQAGGLAALSHGNKIEIRNLADGAQVRVIEDTHKENAYLLKFSGDGTILCSASLDGEVKFWEVDSGKLLQTIEHDSDRVTNGVTFSPDNKTVALCNYEGTNIKLLDLASGEEQKTIFADVFSNMSVAFSPDGKVLASCGQDGDDSRRGGNYGKLWDAETGKRIATLGGFEDCATLVAFSPDGKTLVGASRDTKAFLWDVSEYVK